ncbi:hypothetical protein PCANC_25364 [Puccinia coronata f. sp. avenae]|uniref:Uncharacterized protein n=1 Tax=Puccinia coronata f. sp. avenae TaxID=200324 RepID=A0A2N5TU16_9BASI|nr:hypothetical protein PCANC_25364 [Puccinia coronata f. sp. avenae]PLW31290.1 hypothetical protein PCASD_15184 [Puccinia coronata f. sp. avenae]
MSTHVDNLRDATGVARDLLLTDLDTGRQVPVLLAVIHAGHSSGAPHPAHQARPPPTAYFHLPPGKQCHGIITAQNGSECHGCSGSLGQLGIQPGQSQADSQRVAATGSKMTTTGSPSGHSGAQSDSYGLVNAFTAGKKHVAKESVPSWGGDLMNVETSPMVHEPSFTPLRSKIKLGLQPPNKPKVAPGNAGAWMKLGLDEAGPACTRQRAGREGQASQLIRRTRCRPGSHHKLQSAGWGKGAEEGQDAWNNTSFDEDRPASTALAKPSHILLFPLKNLKRLTWVG